VGDAVDDGGVLLDGRVDWVVLVVVVDVVVVVLAGGLVVVVVLAGDCCVVDSGGGGGATGTTVDPGLPFESVVKIVDELGAVGEVVLLAGLCLPWPTVSASTTARAMAAMAAPTVTTRAVRLYQGSGPGSAE